MAACVQKQSGTEDFFKGLKFVGDFLPFSLWQGLQPTQMTIFFLAFVAVSKSKMYQKSHVVITAI